MASSRRSYYGASQDEFGRSPPDGRRHRSQCRGSSSHRSSSAARQYASRSQSRYRSTSRYRDRSATPPPRGDTSRSQSRYRSTSHYRDRSSSPPSRRDITSRRSRSRSRSPPSKHTVETPKELRRRLLSERVMSLGTYQQLLRNPKSSWAKLGAVGSTPVPVPLHANETIRDYHQKFEFWLAQRNVTLQSLQDDVMRERSFRCGYAQWRAQMAEKNASTMTYGGSQRSRSRSSMWPRDRQGKSSTYRASSPERNVTHRLDSQDFSTVGSAWSTAGCRERNATRPGDSQDFSTSGSTRSTAECHDERHSANRDHETRTWCANCDRKWMDLDRRLKQLERIVAQISVARGRTLNGRSLSLYGRDDNSVVAQDDTVQNLIDLTNDIGAEVNTLSLHSESELDSQPFGESSRNHPRSVEITPTDSDINHEVDWETGEADKPSAPPKADLEFEIPPDLAILINGYNEANGQVLTKQREEKMLVLDLDTEDLDNMRMSNQQDQICKVRDIIDKEKSMRDAAVAAIILFNCVEKHKDIGQEIQTVVASEGAFNQDALHEKCAGIATKLEEKDIELARLHKQLKSLSLLPTNSVIGAQEAQELSSKIGMERAAKLSLETERQKIFSRLMKSSLQIQAMVSEELADKFSNAVEKSVPVAMANDRTSD